MDPFFTKKNCDRCGGGLDKGRILSMMNRDCLCLTCKDKETTHPDYQKARQAEHDELRRGNVNYKGLNG